MSTKDILLIPHLRIHNANALSSPYTIGFPAMTAWLGFVHALERHLKLNDKHDDLYEGLSFLSVGVACHELNLQTYKGEAFVSSIVGTGNPLDKTGKRPSFIEEARCHLDVSLIIEYECDEDEDLAVDVFELVQGKLKTAGGDVLGCGQVITTQVDTEADHRSLMNKLMPSYCLIERRDLMQSAMQQGQDALDALLDHLVIHHECTVDTKDEKEVVTWNSSKREKGWIVPIAVGFQGISELGQAIEQRDVDTPHRFAESVVTLGEFMMPYRIESLDHMLWQYDFEAENNLYLCKPVKSMYESLEKENG